MGEFTKKQIKERVRNGWARADLRYADLSGVDLCYVDLSGADFRYANLRGADLSGANLRGADLSGANLRGADLRYADLCGADFRDANLSGADLHFANLRYADLRDANFGGLVIPDKAVLLNNIVKAIIKDGGKLEMSAWHTCETTRCVGGWACNLSPEAQKLEMKFGTAVAAEICLPEVARHILYGTNKEVLEFLKSISLN